MSCQAVKPSPEKVDTKILVPVIEEELQDIKDLRTRPRRHERTTSGSLVQAISHKIWVRLVRQKDSPEAAEEQKKSL